MTVLEQPRVRRSRQPPPRRRRWLRILLLALALVLVFALGVSLGKALEDGPERGTTVTYVRTLEPLPQQPAQP